MLVTRARGGLRRRYCAIETGGKWLEPQRPLPVQRLDNARQVAGAVVLPEQRLQVWVLTAHAAPHEIAHEPITDAGGAPERSGAARPLAAEPSVSRRPRSRVPMRRDDHEAAI